MAHKKFQNKKGGRRPRRKAAKNPALLRLERAAGLSQARERLMTGPNLMNSWLAHPKGPVQGAEYTVRQFAKTFNTETGLTTLGGGSVAGYLHQNGAVNLMFAIAFRLDDLAQVATFAALFDQYRIEKVKLHIKARNNAVMVANTASPNNAIPSCLVVVDRDDATALATPDLLQEYDNCVEFEGYESCTVELVPSVTRSLFAAGAFSGYETIDSDSVWIDMANTGVPTYGVKGSIGGVTVATTSDWYWTVEAEYIVSFKNTR